MAEEELGKGQKLPTYGAMLHNEMEMDRLEKCGMILVDKEGFEKLRGGKVLFRAHGEPPDTYKQAEENELEVIDTTCGVVKNLQKKIARAFREMEDIGGQVVIFGKSGHPEVLGLLGQTEDKGILIRYAEDLAKVDPAKPVRMFSQTTMDRDEYVALAEKLQQKMLDDAGNEDFTREDSICSHVVNRIPFLTHFATQHDVIIFVSGKDSSNGKKLFNISRKVNPNTYFVSDPDELWAEWLSNAGSVGISGAASTPQWLMEKIADRIKDML